MKTKICNKCLLEKDLSEFYKKGKYYREACKKCYLESYKKAGKKWIQENKDKHSDSSKSWKRRNQSRIKKYRKDYNTKNKDKNSEYMRNYRKDVSHKLSDNLRTRIWMAIKKNQKSGSTLDLLGCSIQELKSHLEFQFKPGMTWNNYGEWHIDHIRPCCSFDMTQETEQKQCFHFSNLQPLWAEENAIKIASDKQLKREVQYGQANYFRRRLSIEVH